MSDNDHPNGASPSVLEALDVAELLGKSEAWVLGECRAGRMQHRRLGKSYRFTREDIDIYLASVKA